MMEVTQELNLKNFCMVDKPQVVVSLGYGQFEERTVALGARVDNSFEVLEGLCDGERVLIP